jgi:hypothetical protein
MVILGIMIKHCGLWAGQFDTSATRLKSIEHEKQRLILADTSKSQLKPCEKKRNSTLEKKLRTPAGLG